MKLFWILTRLRMAEVLRVPSTAFFFFVFPILTLLVTSLLFAGGHPFEEPRVAVFDSSGTVTRSLVPRAVRIQTVSTVESARVLLRTGGLNALVVPNGAGWTVEVTPRQELLGEGLVSHLPRPAILKVVPEIEWGYAQYLGPGILGFSVVLSGLYGLGYSMARYRQSHFLRKLATTPLSKWTFLASQMAGRGALVLIQGLSMVAVLFWLTGLRSGVGQCFWALLICLMGLFVFLGLGLILACFIKDESVLSDAVNALAWPIVLGSGIFFPTDVLPGPLATLTGWLPSTEMVEMLRQILLLNTTPEPGSLLVLLGWGVLAFGAGGVLFKWVD